MPLLVMMVEKDCYAHRYDTNSKQTTFQFCIWQDTSFKDIPILFFLGGGIFSFVKIVDGVSYTQNIEDVGDFFLSELDITKKEKKNKLEKNEEKKQHFLFSLVLFCSVIFLFLLTQKFYRPTGHDGANALAN